MNKDRLRTLRRNIDRGIFVRKDIRELIEWANRRIFDAKFAQAVPTPKKDPLWAMTIGDLFKKPLE
jgi:hypothetical protein